MKQKVELHRIIVWTCIILGALAIVFTLPGCTESEAKTVSRETNQLTAKFIELMNEGKTTRDQEQKFIQAMGNVTFQLDRAIRGDTAATTSQKNAVIEAKTGINPEAPLNLGTSKELQTLKDKADSSNEGSQKSN